MMTEAFWGSRIVFFGEADHGKSSLMGFLYAESQNVDLDSHRDELINEIGSNVYSDDFLYSSLINPVIPDTEGGLKRFSSKRRHLRDFVVDGRPDPILITMIDTPGHSHYLQHQEYGATRGKIGVFCLNIVSVLDDDFDSSIIDRRTRLWFAAHPKLKLIIALTQFDRKEYNEEAFSIAVAKIESCLRPEQIKAMIPIAIDFKNRSGCNIFDSSAKTPWYTGLPLIKAIQEQWYDIANAQFDGHVTSRNLVFSVDREYPRPLSNAGKIWRIYVENGNLSVGQAIQLTSVEVKDDIKSPSGVPVPSVSATIKEFRYDVYINDDDELEDNTAHKGSAVTVNFKDCHAGREKINKRRIFTSPQTIGLSKDEPFSLKRKFCLRFESPEDILWLKDKNQEIVLLIFGRGVPAAITDITEDYSKVFVELLSDKHITVPDNEDLRNLDIFRRIIVRFQEGADRTDPRFAYLPARIDFAATDLI